MSTERGRERRRPTIHDVAALAGVSRGTVSRALNGGRNVSPAALEAVRKAVRTTGYVANPAARSLVTQRAQSMAFVLTEPQRRLFVDPNFSILLQGCTQELAEHDVPPLLMTPARMWNASAPAGSSPPATAGLAGGPRPT
ncbi:LacI family DNA-binding transcriptional regulator [Saccharothrix hoggarensis]|uniref:LacI family DNA-binding transcriptional regulator n=1 Tax=Saccharothrix hoggarensis TaxID=913853 RepID=A0ABW3QK16_9PSEU